MKKNILNVEPMPARLEICSDENYMNKQKVAFYQCTWGSFVRPHQLDKAIELVLDFNLADKNQVGDFLGELWSKNHWKYTNEHGSDVDNMVADLILEENFIADMKKNIQNKDTIEFDKWTIYGGGVGDSDFYLFEKTREQIQDEIIDKIKLNGDIALSENSKRLLDRMKIDLNELKIRIRRELEDEKNEEQEEQEILEMAAAAKAAKKRRLRMSKMFE